MWNRKFSHFLMLFGLCLLAPVGSAFGDKFTLDAAGGGKVDVEARLVGSGQNIHALELATGRILLVAEGSVKKRIQKPGPEPVSGKVLAVELKEMFGDERIRVLVDKPFVIGMVLAAPISGKKKELQVKAALQKSQRFMRNVQSVFLKFTRRVRMKAKPFRFPLVVLIFETDRGFDVYARKIMGNRGLSAGRVAGFYDSLTNYLVLRMSECKTFRTPLHEAIHQQVYNREILQRLAPVPVWFNEGIATGFEGDGERVTGGPRQVSSRYARLALQARAVNWRELVRNDRAFSGDIFAGEAYGQGWGLHWLLVNRYPTKYVKYIQTLGQKKPLTLARSDERLAELEDIVGKDIDELQSEFTNRVRTALKKKR